MTKEKLLEKEFFKDCGLEYAFDPLTNALNRETIIAYANYLIDSKKSFTMCMMDIDNFKSINDNYGHAMGDEILVKFVENVEKLLGDDIVVGRYGGDEFFYIVEGCEEYDDIWQIAHDVNIGLRNESYQGLDHAVTVTCGIARYPLNASNYEELFQKCDKALYRGKMKGRNCFIIYLPEKHANIDVDKARESEKNLVEVNAEITSIIFSKANILKAIKNAVNYLNTLFMADHICIETERNMYLEKISKLSRTQKYNHIAIRLYDSVVGSSGLIVVNGRAQLKSRSPEIFEMICEQDISSMIVCRIQAFGKKYGYIRVDVTEIPRIWQLSEQEVLSNMARCIAVRLHYEDTNLDREFNKELEKNN